MENNTEIKNEQEKMLRKYAESILALEKYLLESVNKHLATQKETLNKSNLEPMKSAMTKVQEICSKQVSELKELVEDLDGGVSTDIKTSIASATATFSGLFSRVRSDQLAKMLRDTYIGLSSLSCGYSMFYTSAIAMDNDDIAESSLKRLKEITPLVVKLSDLLPLAVMTDMDSSLAHKHPAMENLAKMAMQEAWAGEHVHSQH